MIDKIKEILDTGHLRKAENLYGSDKNMSIRELSHVWGIGNVTAANLYSRGIKSVDDLKKNVHLLNEQ